MPDDPQPPVPDLPHAELMLFCRRPAAGKTKTRLAAGTGQAAAAALYGAFVTDLLETAGRVGGSAGGTTGPLAVRLCYVREPGPGGATDREIEAALTGLQRRAGTAFPVEAQVAGDLGRRMAAALAGAFARGANAAAIVGTDSPQMEAAYIGRGLGLLTRADGPRVILGPSTDGGYVLVGARPPLPRVLFEGIPWSTDRVFALTRQALTAAGVSHALLDPLFDVDTLADLRRLRQTLAERQSRGEPVPRHTAGLVQSSRWTEPRA